MNHEMTRQTKNMAANYDSALETFQARANSEAEVIVATLAGMMSATTYLQNELVTSHARAEEVARSQERMEEVFFIIQFASIAITDSLRTCESSSDKQTRYLHDTTSTAINFKRRKTVQIKSYKLLILRRLQHRH
jgi:hypothetical protein